MAEIRCPLYEAAIISKHEPAIVCEERTILFYELDDLASRVARRLIQAKCGAGTRIGLFLPQDWQYIALFLGIIRAGGVACPMNTRLPPDEAIKLFRAINVGAIIGHVSDERRNSVKDLQILDPSSLLEPVAGDDTFEVNPRMDMNQPATICFTSGSGGQPKAVLHSYGNHYYSARGSNSNIRVKSHERWLLSLPLYHVGGIGILFRCLLAGAAVAIPEAGEDPEEACKRMSVTHVSLVSTQLYRALKNRSDRAPFEGVNAILLGGGPMAAELIRDALAQRLPIYPSYGMTEMASQVTTVPPDAPPQKRYSSGKLLRHRRLMISDDGEILAGGETLFKGYVEGERVASAANEDGWFATGDLGHLDAEGYLVVTGRKDFMFISGGENIQPEEIERAIASCAGVERCVVVPVPSAEFGNRPVAVVKGETKLTKQLEDKLPRFKIPDAFLPWPAWADESAKPDRARLMEFAKQQSVS